MAVACQLSKNRRTSALSTNRRGCSGSPCLIFDMRASYARALLLTTGADQPPLLDRAIDREPDSEPLQEGRLLDGDLRGAQSLELGPGNAGAR